MKKQITKFDLEAAFKALDEIEAPKVKGIRPNRMNLSESVKRVDRLSMLVEDYYDLGSSEDLEAAHEDREAEIAQAKLARIEKIVDLNAKTPEELMPSYAGKAIIQCPQCMNIFFKEPADIEGPNGGIDSIVIGDQVNEGEICQHCGNDSGYIFSGWVEAEAPKAEEPAEEEMPEENAVEEIPEEEPVEEEPAEEMPKVDEESEEESSEDTELPDLAEMPAEEEKTEEAFAQPRGKQLVNEAYSSIIEFENSEEHSDIIKSVEHDMQVMDNADEYSVEWMIGSELSSRDLPFKYSITFLPDHVTKGDKEYEDMLDGYLCNTNKTRQEVEAEETKEEAFQIPTGEPLKEQVKVMKGYNLLAITINAIADDAIKTATDAANELVSRTDNGEIIDNEELRTIEKDYLDAYKWICSAHNLEHYWDVIPPRWKGTFYKILKDSKFSIKQEMLREKTDNKPTSTDIDDADMEEALGSGKVQAEVIDAKADVMLDDSERAQKLIESDNTELDKKLAEHNEYIDTLQAEIEKEEKAIEAAKNEFIKKMHEANLESLKAALDKALPEEVKDGVVPEELPDADEVPEEAIEELPEEKEEKKEEALGTDKVQAEVIDAKSDVAKDDSERAKKLIEELTDEEEARLAELSKSGWIHAQDRYEYAELRKKAMEEELSADEQARMDEITKSGVVSANDRNEYNELRKKEKMQAENLGTEKVQAEIIDGVADSMIDDSARAQKLMEDAEDNLDILLDSPEFQKPISENEVEAYLNDSLNSEITHPFNMTELEDLDESSFNKAVSDYLTEVYKNVSGFEATGCEITQNKLVVEGLIKFASGKAQKTQFVFESTPVMKNGKVTLVGLNEGFSAAPCFSLTAVLEANKTILLTEALAYKYKINDSLVEGLVKTHK